MSIVPEDPTVPLDLARYGADARSLELADFLAKHGHAFLLHHGELDPERKALRPQQTMILRKSDAPPPIPTGSPPPPGRSDAVATMSGLNVYPIKNTGRSPFPRIVTVGRTKNNDIVLQDISISKFHAFFKEDGGQFFLTDGESRNGTFVDGQRALTTKQGKPTLVKTGARIKFGGLEFRYIDGKELVALVRQFG